MSNRQYPRARGGAFPLVIAISLVAAAPAFADDSGATPMQKFLGAVGLIDIPKDPIVYRERAPLVVPPSPALVNPRSADDMRAHNPDWPTDHDIGRRKAQKKSEDEQFTDERFYGGVRLSPDEMKRGTRANTRGPALPGAHTPDTGRLTPTELGFKGWNMKKEERVVFTGEPERRSLTEPPPGLRTPSTNAPYGIVTERPEPAKRDPFERGPGHDK
jgi:hypothetical protein